MNPDNQGLKTYSWIINQMADLVDVCIIGAGPAGGSAGIQTSQAGLSTVIVEEHAKIGEPVHCGECLSQKAVDRMGWKKLPKETVSFDVKGVRMVFPDDIACRVTEPGYVLEKHLWEQWIASQAMNAGTEVRLNERVRGLVRKNGEWTIETTKGTINAKVLIDASGVQSVSTSLLKNNPRFSSVVGIQYELENIPQDEYLDFYLWPHLAPQGYLWMIPKSDGRANVGLVTNQNNSARKFLDEFVATKGWTTKKVVKTFGGLIPSSGAMEKTVSDGLMLVGDAAGFTSPLFEGGSQLGLMSGKLAGQTAIDALNANDLSAEFLNRYQAAWKKEFPPYQKLVVGKKLLYDLTEDELKELAAVLPAEMGHLNYVDQLKVGVNLVVSHRGLLSKRIWKVFEAFKYSRSEFYGW